MIATNNNATFDKTNIKELALEVANLLKEGHSNLNMSGKKIPISWILDSAASRHLTYELSILKNVQWLKKPIYMCLPDGSTIKVTKFGQTKLSDDIFLAKVLYSILLRCNLISIQRLTRETKCYVIHFDTDCFI